MLRRLRAIQHVEIIRIGSRVPVFLPQRITPELVAMLRQFHPLWMNIHFNHAKELTPEVVAGRWPAWPTRASRWARRPCCWPASTTRSR